MAGKTVFLGHQNSTTAPAIARDAIDLKAATATPAEQLDETTDSLGAIQRFLLRRRLGKLRMKEAERIAAAVGQAVLESAIYKLTLALDFDKKRAFVDYLRASGELQRELQRLEAQFRQALAVELIRIDSAVSEYKKTANNQIAMMQADGLLNNSEASEFGARYAKVGEDLLSENLSGYEALRGNFRELLTRTLTLFMSELQDNKLL
ncbi:MAG: hypothetical protein KGJ40_02070 [candidate division NC10 bacterium]|nr:hypothetical protein [candidate division NC10 bacterium]